LNRGRIASGESKEPGGSIRALLLIFNLRADR